TEDVERPDQVERLHVPVGKQANFFHDTPWPSPWKRSWPDEISAHGCTGFVPWRASIDGGLAGYSCRPGEYYTSKYQRPGETAP
ncbi:MAG: hypothetical protein WAM90_07960, partial [Rhodanobacter sp.]